jgi:Protein of unknown function (DUF3775)
MRQRRPFREHIAAQWHVSLASLMDAPLCMGKRSVMLKDLNVDQARFVALVAKTARAQRDAVLGHIPDNDLNGTTAARGEHNPTAELGYEPLPARDRQLSALRNALDTLTAMARSELYVLMRIGQGHLAAKKWRRGVKEARLLGDVAVTAALLENPDLHDHLSKGLYETHLAA